ncbi:hypothetical protein F2Q68_00002112 [Brassica cretica]|uniref:Uncharacterized protein n=1 Tax=Brassica cretica TaxID=69181 RepID=A0A8S9JE13_BRACR|nr:hypothetical protein F2Q68_00002112 [Brassica cretica]
MRSSSTIEIGCDVLSSFSLPHRPSRILIALRGILIALKLPHSPLLLFKLPHRHPRRLSKNFTFPRLPSSFLVAHEGSSSLFRLSSSPMKLPLCFPLNLVRNVLRFVAIGVFLEILRRKQARPCILIKF